MMSLENPEALGQIVSIAPSEGQNLLSIMTASNFWAMVSIAPAEGQKSLSIMTDSNSQVMVNPDKFCFGTRTFNTERPRKLSYRKYFNQCLLDVDGWFARDLDYLFVAQYIVEAKQVLDDGNNYRIYSNRSHNPNSSR